VFIPLRARTYALSFETTTSTSRTASSAGRGGAGAGAGAGRGEDEDEDEDDGGGATTTRRGDASSAPSRAASSRVGARLSSAQASRWRVSPRCASQHETEQK
jgi:hypothetical protein